MTLAYVQFVVALVMGLLLSWAGLTVCVALLMPERAAAAQQALESTPKRCFAMGAPLALLAGVAFLALRTPNPAVKLLAFGVLLFIGALVALGAAGLAQLMGKRIGEMSGAKTSFGMLARGSLIYGAAAFFPILGWWLFAPISTLFAAGAGALALRRVRHAPQPAPPLPNQSFNMAS